MKERCGMGGQIGDYEKKGISGVLSADLKSFKEIFKGDSILRVREFHCRGDINSDCAAIYFDGMVNVSVINDAIIKPMVGLGVLPPVTEDPEGDIADKVLKSVLYANEVSITEDMADMLRGAMYGDTLLLINGSRRALVINTKGWKTRGISEPEDERILEGPREGFEEAAMMNLALLRRKLQTPDLCAELFRVGRRTDTKVYICYLESLASKKTLIELKKRLKRIDIDGIFDTNYISELTSDRKYSLFRSTGSTERPDIAAARLLEGRIAVICDGSPMVLTLPYLFAENFQSDEDYYQNFLTASIGRVLRYICFFLSISVPAVYIALTVFHKRLLPTPFLLSVSAAREGVPFSSVVECILLIIIFEILKEAGVRTQQSLGHALSIVGGLVVGQAAVEAKIVSAPMLIVVALSGIAGLMIPRLRAAVFYLRLGYVLFASALGLFGYMTAMAATMIRIMSLSSFGVDSTPSLADPTAQKLKDTVIRARFGLMRTRPAFNTNRTRMRYYEERKPLYEDICEDENQAGQAEDKKEAEG